MIVSKEQLDNLRNELSINSKNGVDFIISASIIWAVIGFIWTLSFSAYDKSILTFIVGGLMLPFAFFLSKLLKINWTNKSNPLQPLGLWLNFAQLFYFPFLIFTLIRIPDYFVMVYVIITGAHFFPYAWFYKTKWFAIFSGIIVIGALLLGLNLHLEKMFYIPLFMSLALILLTIFLIIDAKIKQSK